MVRSLAMERTCAPRLRPMRYGAHIMRSGPALGRSCAPHLHRTSRSQARSVAPRTGAMMMVNTVPRAGASARFRGRRAPPTSLCRGVLLGGLWSHLLKLLPWGRCGLRLRPTTRAACWAHHGGAMARCRGPSLHPTTRGACWANHGGAMACRRGPRLLLRRMNAGAGNAWSGCAMGRRYVPRPHQTSYAARCLLRRGAT